MLRLSRPLLMLIGYRRSQTHPASETHTKTISPSCAHVWLSFSSAFQIEASISKS